MRIRELRLSKEGFERILAQGKVSFIPMARNQCVCRQDPSLGPLGKRGVRYVHSFAEGLLAPHLTERIKPVPIPIAVNHFQVERSLLKVIVPDLSFEADIKCPSCTRDLTQRRQGDIKCPYCCEILRSYSEYPP